MGRLGLAMVIMLAGGAIIVGGIGWALLEFGQLYAGVAADPLGQPEGFEDEQARRMLYAAGVGATGVPVFLVGVVMLVRGRARKSARERAKRAAARALASGAHP